MIRFAAFGDSLTEGYGLPIYSSFPSYLERCLLEGGHNVEMLNFGVSGETSADGLLRLPEVLSTTPDAVYIEFGANDCFQFVNPAETEENLGRMIEAFQKNGSSVLLLGYNPLDFIPKTFAKEFTVIFERVAGKYKIPFHPDLMQGLYGQPNLLLSDGVHPSEEGVRAMVENLYPLFEELLTGLNKR
jgi:acyl-CoA thioesterase-1